MILDPKHREQFLHNQKVQRQLSQLKELEVLAQNSSINSLKKVQALIDKLNELDKLLLPNDEQKSFEKVEKRVLERRDQIQQEQKIPDTAIQLVDQLAKVLSKPTATPQQLTQFKSKWQNATKNVKSSESFKQLNEQFQQQCLKLAEKIEHSAATRDQAANSAVELIDVATKHIEEGQLTLAKTITNQIAENKKLAGFSHPVIKRNKYQLDQVWNKLKELRNWQKWSNDKARREIIKSVAAMHGQGLHPDAVLKKLKDSNEQWYSLEDMEKLPGDKYPSRNQELWQEFRRVSKAVFEPTQPFFEKRSEQQQDRLDQINQLIDEMNTCDLENTTERDLARMTRHGVKELKALDTLPPKQRGKVAKKLRKAINRIDHKLNEFYQEAENKKLKLIEQVKALHEMEDLSEAIEQAKALQQQWRTAGIVKQYTERKLWKNFRKANDALFNKRDQIKQEVNKAQQQQKKALQDFIKEKNKAVKSISTIDALNDFKGNVQKKWQELDNPNRLLQTDFTQLLQQVDDKVTQLMNKDLIDAYKQKEQLDQSFSQFEQGQIDEQKLTEIKDQYDAQLINSFKLRLNDSYTEESLYQKLIEAEFLTGLETPEENMEQRMAYQVQILSERMSGERNQQDFNQARMWLDEWFLLPKTDDKFIKKNQQRIKQAIKAIKQLAFG
jgi:exonuclease SbcC